MKKEQKTRPAMETLIHAVRMYDFQCGLMDWEIRTTEAYTEEEFLRRAKEIIEDATNTLRRQDIQNLLRQARSEGLEIGEDELALDLTSP